MGDVAEELARLPNELLLGLVVNTPKTPVEISTAGPPAEDDISRQMAYVAQQRLDGYEQILGHAERRKAAFDRNVMMKAPREVIFQTIRKLEPKWSVPRRVVGRDRNSYTLATLKGAPITGRFSSRRLRRFIPRKGTALATEQELVETALALAEEEADKPGLEEMRRGLLDGDDRADEAGERDGDELEDEDVGDDVDENSAVAACAD